MHLLSALSNYSFYIIFTPTITIIELN